MRSLDSWLALWSEESGDSRSYILSRAVLEDTLVAGVSSLEGELDALVVAEGGGDLGSGGLRHFEESLCVSGKLGRGRDE